jgi:hypothetical protein
MVFKGGVVDEPLLDLARVLSTLLGKDGKVSMPGFYDNVRPLEPYEDALYDEIIRRGQGFVRAYSYIACWFGG